MESEPLGTGNILCLRGDIGVNNAAELQQSLIDHLNSNAEMGVDLSEVAELDLSAIQLLCAAQRVANKAGHAITRSGSLSESVRERFQLAGLDPFNTGAQE